jgi:hypothetical protein
MPSKSKKQKSENHATNPDIVWGAEAIGAVINKRRRPAFYLLESGRLPAKKIGGQWAASRRALISHISGEAE